MLLQWNHYQFHPSSSCTCTPCGKFTLVVFGVHADVEQAHVPMEDVTLYYRKAMHCRCNKTMFTAKYHANADLQSRRRLL